MKKVVKGIEVEMQDEVKISLPAGAKILSLQDCRGRLCLWILANPEAEEEEREIHFLGSEDEVKEGLKYIQTLTLKSGNYRLDTTYVHVFIK